MNKFTKLNLGVCVFVLLIANSSNSFGHDGPDPVAHWILSERSVVDEKIEARLGPDAKIIGKVTPSGSGVAASLHFDGKSLGLINADHSKLASGVLPKKNMTVSTWFSVEEEKEWGGIVCVCRDNGNAEKGWVVGYNQRRFYFGLATTGADDGNGKMTYLESDVRYEKGKMYHVVAIYDGSKMQLMVNGKLAGESTEQSGDILYPESTPFVLGAYKDSNEDHRHVGRIREVAIYDIAAKPEWAAIEFSHLSKIAEMPGVGAKPVKFDFAIQPYLQNVTKNSITVMWETTRPGSSVVNFGETAKVETKSVDQKRTYIHEVTLDDLQPETQYFYRIASKDDQGEELTGEVLTFQTANHAETPFTFAIMSDTQGNPEVSGKFAKMAWAHRPNFLMHPGDLVSTGTVDSQWKNQFFPSMHPLIGRVAFFPVLGNHEVNARNYYDYMSLPSPEYYYQFTYGNTDFFMLDTNKNVDPNSEQYKWLDKALSKSKAEWKIVCHHHPAYSSDENDYGDLWKTNKSTQGDPRVKKLTKLYDKHAVDIVWCGHIHSYERTWSVKDGKPVAEGDGPMYMITGGGGGSLETAGPFKPGFQNNVRHGHHYCLVSINRGTLEFKAFDIDGRMFDCFKRTKSISGD